MTYDSIYWLVLGASFLLTGLAGVGVMLKTERVLPSFIAGTLVNLIISGGAIWWWMSVFHTPEQHFSRMFGVFGLGVSLVNNEVLLLFAQLIMKRKIGKNQTPPAPEPDDDW